MSARTYSVFEVKHHLIGQLYLKGHLNLNPVGLLLDITHSNKEKVMGYKWGDLMLISSQFFVCPRSPKGERGILFYLCPSVRPSKIFFVAFFSVTVDGRNLIFGHKLHIGSPYRGKLFRTYQIPTSCLPILLIFIHI